MSLHIDNYCHIDQRSENWIVRLLCLTSCSNFLWSLTKTKTWQEHSFQSSWQLSRSHPGPQKSQMLSKTKKMKRGENLKNRGEIYIFQPTQRYQRNFEFCLITLFNINRKSIAFQIPWSLHHLSWLCIFRAPECN